MKIIAFALLLCASCDMAPQFWTVRCFTAAGDVAFERVGFLSIYEGSFLLDTGDREYRLPKALCIAERRKEMRAP